MSSLGFVIRFHYHTGDPRFEWRLSYFRSMVLPRLEAQTDQEFEIAIRCLPEHGQIFEALSPRIRTFQVRNETQDYITKRGQRYFADFVPWKDVIGMEPYDIQAGLDSDDLITSNYVETIRKTIRDSAKDRAFHLSFQPQLFDLRTLSKQPMRPYTPRRGSAFFALYQPDKAKYRFAYEISHRDLWLFAEKSVVLPQGHCYATAHHLNESTGVSKRDENILVSTRA